MLSGNWIFLSYFKLAQYSAEVEFYFCYCATGRQYSKLACVEHLLEGTYIFFLTGDKELLKKKKKGSGLQEKPTGLAKGYYNSNLNQ